MTSRTSVMRAAPRTALALLSRFIPSGLLVTGKLDYSHICVTLAYSRAESSIPDTPHHQASMASSNFSNHPHDPYAFSRVGNQRFVEGDARSSNPPQTQDQENVARLTSGVFSSSVAPSHASSTISQPPSVPAIAQPSHSSTPTPSLHTSSRLAPSVTSSAHAALSFSSTTSFAPAPPSATRSALLVPLQANAPSSSSALNTAVTPFVSQATLPPPTKYNTTIDHGMRALDQVPDREHSQVPTEEDIEKLFAFFYSDRGRLPPHAVSSYSSLAGAVSEPGPSASRSVHPLGAPVGGQVLDDRNRNQPAKDVDKSDAIDSLLAFPTQTAITDEMPSHEVLPLPSGPAAPPPRLPADFVQEAGPLPTTSSAVAPTSAKPARPGKRKATAPPAGDAQRVEAQAKQRNKRTTKGRRKTIEPEPNPESESEPESGPEGTDGNALVLEEESAEAIRSRKRRGRRKDGIHALYAEVAKFIKVEPLETLSLDEVVQLAVDFLGSCGNNGPIGNNRFHGMQEMLRNTQSELGKENLKNNIIASELDAMRHERDALKGQLKTTEEELERVTAQSLAAIKESQASAEKARLLEIQARQYTGLAKHYFDINKRQESELAAAAAELQRCHCTHHQ
ncbi:hypothetical protein EVG20_g6338 [Dentipellis fragilis]|uniref:Uncharacterized protein n=1 Tax=Dentipellis fragilis TaxID=205917 RepID=A0A4Y9YNU7_9AGAM|nr:hypothetical protein EVG20_g6338 [Dentipellis fragilis]